jgi:hypothetical protein
MAFQNVVIQIIHFEVNEKWTIKQTGESEREREKHRNGNR